MKNSDIYNFTVFFDIDGVLGDFDRHLDVHGLRGADGNPRWNELTLEWWRSMPAVDGAQDFFARVAATVPARFLTAPTLSADCFAGKAEWVQKFLPHEGKGALKRLIIAPSTDKAYLAARTRILIDDRQKNIDEWEKAGGVGIHFAGNWDEVEAKLLKALRGVTLPATVPVPAVRGDASSRFPRR